MADKNKMLSADRVYTSLLEIVKRYKYDFDDDDEIMTVNFDVQYSSDLVPFTVTVDAERQLIRLYSPLGVKVDENIKFESAALICKFSHEIENGSLDYDLYSGSVEFRMATSFNGSLISDSLLEDMISYTCFIVIKYTAKLIEALAEM